MARETGTERKRNERRRNVPIVVYYYVTYFSVYYKWCAVKRNESRSNGRTFLFRFVVVFFSRFILFEKGR